MGQLQGEDTHLLVDVQVERQLNVRKLAQSLRLSPRPGKAIQKDTRLATFAAAC